VAPDRLRFDFSHFKPLTAEELERIERRVNEAIRANAETEARVMPLQQALDAGAMALFGEKYGDDVRVLSMGGFSTELCGGTHVRRTGDIGVFKIVSESGVASGIRRIEAVTGENALNYIGETEKHLSRVAELVRGGRGDLDEKVGQLVERPASWRRNWRFSRAGWPVRPGRTSRTRPWMWAASKSWRPIWKGPIRNPCARPWTSSRTSWARPPWSWPRSATAR
jgi:alanyl-tRNA synthetase